MAPETLDVLREVGHRLRTPLATIHGYASLLEAHVVDDRVDAVALADWARRIQTETERLSSLLADVSRLRTLDEPLRTTPIDLQALVAEAVEVAQAESDQPIRLEDGPPVAYMGDARLLRRAIYHVLSTAVRRPQTPRVRVVAAERPRVEVHVPAWPEPTNDVWRLFTLRVLNVHGGHLVEQPQCAVIEL